MYKQFLILLTLITIFLSCKTNKESIDIGEFDKENYWKQDYYLTLQQLRNEKIDSIIPYLEYYGTLESVYGDVRKAQWLFDTVEIIRDYTQYKLDEKIVDYKPQNAFNIISQLAKGKQLVMINEAHHRPEHRIFTTQLLKKLHKQGFSYIALEGLSMRDSLLQKRGYPNNKSGIYIQNTSYANLIRVAMDLGIKVISYDTYASNNNIRDSLQAINIYNQTYALDTSAKVIIHAGYGHIGKKKSRYSRPMGFVLAKRLNTIPLVIDQTLVIERQISSVKNENYQFIFKENGEIDEVSVLKYDNDIWCIHSNYDISVIHPPTRFSYFRPTYLIFDDVKPIKLPKSINKKKYLNHLIKVFKEKEPSSAVPIDQFELSNLGMKIIVPIGKYRVEVYNYKNEIIKAVNIIF
ncbi:MAG: hypothetical protein AB8G11_00050 [Saprospiraceae bacterium]